LFVEVEGVVAVELDIPHGAIQYSVMGSASWYGVILVEESP
jgi:hypothetical protein